MHNSVFNRSDAGLAKRYDDKKMCRVCKITGNFCREKEIRCRQQLTYHMVIKVGSLRTKTGHSHE